MIMQTRNLGWSARGLPIVEAIDLDVIAGETLGLVGPNGSGKSTLLKLLAGIRKPSSGSVAVKGRPLAAMRRREAAQSIAFLEQHAETSEAITVRDAVELGRTPWLTALQPWSHKDESIVAQSLADVDMAGFGQRSWATLSGGERQRVHLARALAQCPEILLLDEPTNHLDVHHQLSILELVARLPVTSIVALHDLNQALACDRVGVLARGRLVALGAPHEVLTVERLHAVFGVRASIVTDPADGARLFRFHALQ
ncbi:iron complex transport system ATP-binding protein [Mesorhizobium albiziae]|uniref:Iron complex transport system ATP-binding protein n=1 Tax=Neomesorhizobium albiziae TaxID=335020 RepID=A0A1I3YUP6_9HYPH|nr:ABC transporter ATP-binding protein [Mesorhizobium albiziae]GLS33294.1 histidinol-phosphatase [Mesorhizobium albiziae]SFK34961.1 iron complex transport system ATP-binding protein [Mesorhizobium albiziae]